MTDLLMMENATPSTDETPFDETGPTFIPVEAKHSTAPCSSSSSSSATTKVDMSLLRGLEPALLEEEQARLTALLTSGEADDLATAAKVFYELGLMLKEGAYSPTNRSTEHHTRLQESFVSQVQHRNRNRPGLNNREARVLNEKKLHDVVKRERARLVPLPVRMPRMVVMEPFDPSSKKKKTLTFLDDPWDGSLGSAFTKLEVHRNKKGPKGLLQKLRPNKENRENESFLRKSNSHCDHNLKFSPGFDAIVDLMPDGYSTKLDGIVEGDARPRVLVASLHQQASKLAVQRGDVVTHVNGQEFVGTAQDLEQLLADIYAQQDDGQKLELVFNAEVCIAHALKLRSMLVL